MAASAIDILYTNYSTKAEITTNDFEFIANVFRGFLKDPDVVPSTSLAKMVTLMKKCADAPITTYWPFTRDVRRGLLETMNRILGRLHLERKLMLVSTPHEHGSGLYGYARELAMNTSYDSLKALMKDTDYMINKYVDTITLKLNPTESEFVYKTTNIEVKLKADQPYNLRNNEFFIKSNDVFFTIPNDIYATAQSQASDHQEIKLKMMKWMANPFIYEPEEKAHVENNVTTLTILNTAGREIRIQNISTPINIMMPYSKSKNLHDSSLRCKFWDETNQEFS